METKSLDEIGKELQTLSDASQALFYLIPLDFEGKARSGKNLRNLVNTIQVLVRLIGDEFNVEI